MKKLFALAALLMLGAPAVAQFGGTFVQTVPSRLTAQNIGASVSANTSTPLAAAFPLRRGFQVQNQTAGNCYLSGLATATADFNSLLIASGAFYQSDASHVGTGQLNVICAQAGGVYARQW